MDALTRLSQVPSTRRGLGAPTLRDPKDPAAADSRRRELLWCYHFSKFNLHRPIAPSGGEGESYDDDDDEADDYEPPAPHRGWDEWEPADTVMALAYACRSLQDDMEVVVGQHSTRLAALRRRFPRLLASVYRRKRRLQRRLDQLPPGSALLPNEQFFADEEVYDALERRLDAKYSELVSARQEINDLRRIMYYWKYPEEYWWEEEEYGEQAEEYSGEAEEHSGEAEEHSGEAEEHSGEAEEHSGEAEKYWGEAEE